MADYTAPAFNKAAFSCPHCGAYAKQVWSSLYYNPRADERKIHLSDILQQEHIRTTLKLEVYNSPVYADREQVTEICDKLLSFYEELANTKASRCEHCEKYSYWIIGRMIYPAAGTVEMPNADMPEDCQNLYLEARDIAGKSPRAAAALLRLCVEQLLPHLGVKSKNINEGIAELVRESKIPSEVQKALDICRVTGNHAVHPGKIDAVENPKTIQSLFKILNMIVEKTLTAEKEIDALYADLPQDAQAAITTRDEKSD